tara:strand:- start:7 stop:507 length:501 start_codon:yes stop_codon:yes gene_type:complete
MVVSSKGLLGSVILSAAILLGSNVAHAQQVQLQPGMMGHQGMMGGGQGMMGGGQGMMGMMHGPMLEGRLAHIKAELAITDAQSAAWNGYADAVKARATGMQGMHDAMMKAMQSGTAMERMDAHIKAMETMTEALKALKPVTEALYAVLTPDQKQKADQALGMGCMM